MPSKSDNTSHRDKVLRGCPRVAVRFSIASPTDSPRPAGGFRVSGGDGSVADNGRSPTGGVARVSGDDEPKPGNETLASLPDKLAEPATEYRDQADDLAGRRRDGNAERAGVSPLPVGPAAVRRSSSRITSPVLTTVSASVSSSPSVPNTS